MVAPLRLAQGPARARQSNARRPRAALAMPASAASAWQGWSPARRSPPTRSWRAGLLPLTPVRRRAALRSLPRGAARRSVGPAPACPAAWPAASAPVWRPKGLVLQRRGRSARPGHAADLARCLLRALAASCLACRSGPRRPLAPTGLPVPQRQSHRTGSRSGDPRPLRPAWHCRLVPCLSRPPASHAAVWPGPCIAPAGVAHACAAKTRHPGRRPAQAPAVARRLHQAHGQVARTASLAGGRYRAMAPSMTDGLPCRTPRQLPDA